MLPIPPDGQAQIDEYIEKLAGCMMKYTEPEKLEDFESIEVEVRDQIQKKIAPKIGEFFFSKGGKKKSGKQRKVKTMVGEVKISQKQAQKLGLSPQKSLSPAIEKCCLRMCAKSSYQQAEEDLFMLMGLNVGHSTLHRLVVSSQLPLGLRI